MATALTGGKGRVSADPGVRRPAGAHRGDRAAVGGREDVVDRLAGITVVLGGARSGKSEVGEQLAAAVDGPVTYVATGTFDAGDATGPASWSARVARHRARRPREWATVEVPQGGDLAGALRTVEGTALVDSLGAWVAGLPGFGQEVGASEPTGALIAALLERRQRRCRTVVVSDEVGMGVHPPSAVGVAFADALGSVNRAVSGVADRALLVVAGRTLVLGPAHGAPEDAR